MDYYMRSFWNVYISGGIIVTHVVKLLAQNVGSPGSDAKPADCTTLGIVN